MGVPLNHPSICPLCERDLAQAFLVLGMTNEEGRKAHATIHVSQMYERVWNRAASQEESEDMHRIEDWATGER